MANTNMAMTCTAGYMPQDTNGVNKDGGGFKCKCVSSMHLMTPLQGIVL